MLREVAEYFGFWDKYDVKELVKRERAKQRKQEAGIVIRPKGRPRKDAALAECWGAAPMRSTSQPIGRT